MSIENLDDLWDGSQKPPSEPTTLAALEAQFDSSELAKTLKPVHDIQLSVDTLEKNTRRLTTMRASINAIITSMNQRKSTITKIADAWAELSLLQKVGYGLLVSGPTLGISIVVNASILLTVILTTAVSALYTTLSKLLDEHHNEREGAMEDIKAGVTGVVDLLDEAICSFSEIRDSLAAQINQLAQHNGVYGEQNLAFGANLKELGAERENLAQQIRALDITNKFLTQSGEQSAEVLAINQQQIDSLLGELAKKDAQIEAFMKKIDGMGELLAGTIGQLTQTLKLQPEQQAQFQKKLEDCLSGNQEKLTDFLFKMSGMQERLEKTEAKLAKTQQDAAKTVRELKECIRALKGKSQPNEEEQQKLKAANIMAKSIEAAGKKAKAALEGEPGMAAQLSASSPFFNQAALPVEGEATDPAQVASASA